jgi:hypothetical protein
MYSRLLPANVVAEWQQQLRGLAATKAKQYSSFETDFAGGEGPATRSKPWPGTVSGGASRPPVVLFIALPEPKDNSVPG